MITQSRLKELFRYDPSTGHFIRRVTRSHNARAGSVAGTLTKGTKSNGGGYIMIHIDGRFYLGHRLAFLYMTGRIPPSVDHRNHIRSDNRWVNLREVHGQLENGQNLSRKANNTSGVTGVYWDKRRQLWVAEIMVNRRKVFLGRFASIGEAAAAREAARSSHGFHDNHGKELVVEPRVLEAAE